MYKSSRSHYCAPSSWFTRYIMAGQEDTAVPVLVSLAFDSCARVRRHAAENPRIPANLLVKLSQDSSTDVRVAVAENPRCSRGLLRMLALDDSSDVRLALAENHALPTEILELLLVDDNPFVAHRAGKTLEECGQHGIEGLAA